MSAALTAKGASDAAVHLYTDGGAAPNPGPGGWGVVVVDANGATIAELSGSEANTTNNRMELTAAIRGLASQSVGGSCVLHTDSTYVRSGITQWIDGWIRKNWRRGPKGNEPVKNEDLWRELHELDRERKVDWRWLKGHAGHEHNERADELATAAILAGGGDAAPSASDIAQAAASAVESADVQAILKIRAWKGTAQWLALLLEDDQQCQLDGRETQCTANRAELIAGLAVLEAVDRSRSIGFRCGDYFARGCSQWLPDWKRRGWTTSSGDPVKNKDLWIIVERVIAGRPLSFASLPKTGPLAAELKRRLKGA